MQGLGGGSILSLTQIIVGDIVPLHKRGVSRSEPHPLFRYGDYETPGPQGVRSRTTGTKGSRADRATASRRSFLGLAWYGECEWIVFSSPRFDPGGDREVQAK